MDVHDGAAGWAQFAGAVLAVFASYRFAAGEAKRAHAELIEQRRRDAEADASVSERDWARLVAIRTAARVLVSHAGVMTAHALEILKELRGQPGPVFGETARMCAADVRAIEARLLSFPIHELSDAGGVRTFAQACTVAGATLSLLEQFQARGHRPGFSFPPLDPLQEMYDSFEACEVGLIALETRPEETPHAAALRRATA